MTYQGHFQNGVVVLDDSAAIPDGVRVRVELLPSAATQDSHGGETEPTLYESLKSLAGVIKDWPADFAKNHDHYIHGAPKK